MAEQKQCPSKLVTVDGKVHLCAKDDGHEGWCESRKESWPSETAFWGTKVQQWKRPA